MKLSISFLAFFCLLALIMPELISGQPAGQRRKPAAAAPAPRSGRKLSQPAKFKRPINLRRGKQEGGEAEAPPAPAEGDAAAAEGEVPAWCDPTKEMGAWLNFVKMRKWCADNGFTDFGPYGGVPAEGEEGANDAGAEAPAEESA